MSEELHSPQSDHDLLIRIDTKLGILMTDFHTVKKDVVRLEELKANKKDLAEIMECVDLKSDDKSNKTDHCDYESRLRRLERYGAIAIGGLAIIQIVISKI